MANQNNATPAAHIQTMMDCDQLDAIARLPATAHEDMVPSSGAERDALVELARDELHYQDGSASRWSRNTRTWPQHT